MSDAAAGVTTVVLLPGMDGSGELFLRFVSALGIGIEALVLRYPAERPTGYAELVELVDDALPKDRPYVLLAESFSGPVAMALAARGPTLLRGLVLCCTFACNPRPALRRFGPLLPLAPLTAMPTAALGRVLMGRYFDRVLNADLAAALKPLSSGAMRTRLRAVLSVDATARLRAVSVPTLYLRASEDLVVPRAAGELLLHLKPDIELVELPGPHFLLQTRPLEAAEVVRRFMRRLTS